MQLFKNYIKFAAFRYVILCSLVKTDKQLGHTFCLHFQDKAVALWLRSSATNLKVAGSIPAGVSEFFIDIIECCQHRR